MNSATVAIKIQILSISFLPFFSSVTKCRLDLDDENFYDTFVFCYGFVLWIPQSSRVEECIKVKCDLSFMEFLLRPAEFFKR